MRRDIATLKSYFETGDIPTEGEFSDLIDSFWPKTEKIPGSALLSLPAYDKDGNFKEVRIWVGMSEDLPPDAERTGTKTIYIALENNAELQE